MANIKLRNKSQYDFIDISSEKKRRYTFESGMIIEIDQPQGLSISKTGHRILNINEKCFYIPNKGICLDGDVYEDSDHFVR